jgi:hypothetical protein
VFRSTTLTNRWVQLALIGVLLTISTVLGLWYLKQKRLAQVVERNSVAVLPLQNMSQDKSQDCL